MSRVKSWNGACLISFSDDIADLEGSGLGVNGLLLTRSHLFAGSGEHPSNLFLSQLCAQKFSGPELVEQLMRAALGNPGSAIAAQGFLSVPGLLQSDELRSVQEQGDAFAFSK